MGRFQAPGRRTAAHRLGRFPPPDGRAFAQTGRAPGRCFALPLCSIGGCKGHPTGTSHSPERDQPAGRRIPRLDGNAVVGRGLLSWFSDARIDGGSIRIERRLSGAQGSTDGSTKKRAIHYPTIYGASALSRSISPSTTRRGTPCLTCSTLTVSGGIKSSNQQRPSKPCFPCHT